MSLSRNTTYNIVGSIIPLAVGLVAVPLYLRLIGPDRYGVLAIAWLLLGYFGLFDLGLGRATSFRIAALRDASSQERADTFWAAIAVNLGVGVVGGVILWVAASFFFGRVFKVDEHLRPEIMRAVPLLALSVPIATLTGVLTGALQGREQFLKTNIVSASSTILFQVLPVAIAATNGPDLLPVLGGAVSARLLAMVVLAYQCHVEITRHNARRLRRDEMPILLGYGGWVTLTSIFGPVLVMVDRFAIGGILGASLVAIYTVPYQLAKQVAVLPTALTNAMFPAISAAAASERQDIVDRSTRTLIALVSLPVLLAVFLLEPGLYLYVGKHIGAQSAPAGRMLLIGFWANAFALIPYTQLQGSGRPDLVTKALLLEIPPYLIILYAGLSNLGLMGAAVAWAFRCVMDYVVLSWMADRRLPGARLLGPHLLLMCAAVGISNIWTFMDPRLWAAATVLGALTAALSWRDLPIEVKRRITGQAAQLIGRFS